MSEFFAEGGVGMFPVSLFGFLAIASSVLYLLRPERRFVGLIVGLGTTTLCAALLGFSLGLVGVFHYVQHVPASEQINVVTQGISESLHNVVLALALLVIVALVSSAGAFRAARLGVATVAA